MNYKLWIDGKWEDTQGGSMMSIEDPTTGQEIAEVINASRAGCGSRRTSGQNCFL